MKTDRVLFRHYQDALADDGTGQSKVRRRRTPWFCPKLALQWRAAAPKQRALWVASLVVSVYAVYWLYRKSRPLWEGNRPWPKQELDFLVAGFPKCGTTSLLLALHQHPDVLMDDTEYCDIARPLQQDDINMARFNKYLSLLKKDRRAGKLGIKCPEALKNFKSIHRLSQHSPTSKWVVGLRHPILFIQSFYNYRVAESHTRAIMPEEIPSLHRLWENKTLSFRDLTRDSARFDLFLAQLGKTSLNLTQLQAFIGYDLLAVKPNRLSIFLYAIEQIDDKDAKRKRSFQNDLLHFLNLDPQRLPVDFGHENKNRATGSAGYPETINICATSYADIRASLLDQGTRAARWILDEFLASPDVSVSNPEHFRETLQKWSQDPCHDGLDV